MLLWWWLKCLGHKVKLGRNTVSSPVLVAAKSTIDSDEIAVIEQLHQLKIVVVDDPLGHHDLDIAVQSRRLTKYSLPAVRSNMIRPATRTSGPISSPGPWSAFIACSRWCSRLSAASKSGNSTMVPSAFLNLTSPACSRTLLRTTDCRTAGPWVQTEFGQLLQLSPAEMLGEPLNPRCHDLSNRPF